MICEFSLDMQGVKPLSTVLSIPCCQVEGENIAAPSYSRARLPVCYLMEWQDFTHFQLCSADTGVPPREGGAGTGDSTGRVDLRARIVSLQPEVMETVCIQLGA